MRCRGPRSICPGTVDTPSLNARLAAQGDYDTTRAAFVARQPIIEAGHLFIAQPPLYKASRGRSEVYLKDEAALEQYLVDNGVDTMVLETSGGARGGDDQIRRVMSGLPPNRPARPASKIAPRKSGGNGFAERLPTKLRGLMPSGNSPAGTARARASGSDVISRSSFRNGDLAMFAQ